MNRRRSFPLSPIWNPDKQTGSIIVGSTPPAVPSVPVVAYLGFEAETTLDGANSILKYGSLYLVRGTGCMVYMDISNPVVPAINSYAANTASLAGGQGIAFDDDDYIYAPAGGSPGSLSLYDALGDPDYVDVLSDSDLNGARGVARSGSHVVVVGGSDLAAGSSPGFLATVDPGTFTITGVVTDDDLQGAESVAVDGDYAYVACRLSGRLVVVDISTPASPSVAGSLANANFGDSYSIKKVGSWCYMTSYSETDGYLTIVDVSTPATPTLLGQLESSDIGGAEDVSVDGNYAYLACAGVPCVAVVDCTDPTTPTVSSTATHGSLNYPTGILKDGPYVLVADTLGDAFFVFGVS